MISAKSSLGLPVGCLRKVHHIALNVKNMEASKHFYGNVLGLHQLTGDEVPSTLVKLVAAGKVCNFKTPDGIILDLFAEPDLSPPDPDPEKQFTRANHLSFDIEPQLFDKAIAILKKLQIPVAIDVVTRLTGRGFYIYDPDGFIVEIRCDPVN
ncbi:VOC family protein [Pleurocapsa sp. CCALA 161]|uniref:VOC family protein n=1 Tax=Pleurocapsa sp. CCALA 161 TaxID=2107688 RepID=UPI000D0547B0|nr:VOC family protein [Pleurocapsa sp. CCALA 161]PSB09671.1 VOC family protein [Pleurocapsa sp. CCALA 161]